MNTSQLNRVFNQLKSGKVIDSHNITRGLANISYIITADAGEKYVVRQLRAQPPYNVQDEAVIQKILKRNGINVPIYLTLGNGDVVGQESGYNFTISAFIEGTGPTKRTLKLAHSYGETLALIHNALDPDRVKIRPSPAQWLNADNASKNIAKCAGPLHDKLQHQFDSSRHILELGLPTAIIHADLMEDNVFVKDDEITAVFDFETAEESIRLLDLARSYLSLGYRRELDSVELRHALFKGYNSTASEPLTEEEIKGFPLALSYTAAVCSGWLMNNGGTEFVQPFLDAASSYKRNA